jgi:hypothetical protein
VPPDAVLLRVEPDEPVGVFVERTWPLPDYGYRNKQKWRLLRETAPVAPGPSGYSVPASLGEVAHLLREVGVLTDDREATA